MTDEEIKAFWADPEKEKRKLTGEEKRAILRAQMEEYYGTKMREATPEEVNRVRRFFEEQAKKRGKSEQPDKE